MEEFNVACLAGMLSDIKSELEKDKPNLGLLLEIAIQLQDFGIFNIMYGNSDSEIRKPLWFKLLCESAGDNNEHKIICLRSLNRLGVIDLEIKNSQGETGLHMACSNNNLAMIKFFLEEGADVNAVDENGETPMFRTTCLDCLKLLVSKGAVLDHVNLKGETTFVSLMHCASCFNMDEILYLIENGVDVHFRFNYNNENREVTVMDCLERNLFWFPEQIQEAIRNAQLPGSKGAR